MASALRTACVSCLALTPGCATTGPVEEFDAGARARIAGACLRILEETWPFFEETGVLPEDLVRRWQDALEEAPDRTRFHRILARMFASLGDPHLRLLPVWQPAEAPGTGSLPPLELVRIGGRWHLLRGPAELEGLGPLPALCSVAGIPLDRGAGTLELLLLGPAGTEVEVEWEGVHGREIRSLRRPPATPAVEPSPRGEGVPPPPPVPRSSPREESPRSSPAHSTGEPSSPPVAAPTPWLRVERAGDLAYLRIASFDPPAVQEAEAARVLDAAVDALGNPPLLVLDLQGNPGGRVDLSARLAERFLQERTLWGRRLGPGSRRGGQLWLDPRPPAVGGRLAVLVDASTASAAELLAELLQRSRGALLVGETTLGAQGVVREERLPDGSVLSLTAGGLDLPADRDFQGIGLVPDLAVPLDLELARARGLGLAVASARLERLETAVRALGGALPPEAMAWPDRLVATRRTGAP